MSPAEVRLLVARDYLVMAYLGSLGAIQIATAYSGLAGLWLLPWRQATRLLGVAMVVAGIAYFLLAPLWTPGPWGSGDGPLVVGAEGEMVPWGTASMHDVARARNINDINGGLSGNTQALGFAIGAGAGILTTYALGSLVNARRRRVLSGGAADGMEALRGATFPGAIGRSLGYWRGNGLRVADGMLARGRGVLARLGVRGIRGGRT